MLSCDWKTSTDSLAHDFDEYLRRVCSQYDIVQVLGLVQMKQCAESTVVAVRDAYLGLSLLVPYWQNNTALGLRIFRMFW